MKPRLLDLFCGAGGCTAGYQRAGFWVRGVDIKPQPRYCGDQFIQADALEYLAGLIESGEIEEFDAIHASPPCQGYMPCQKNRHHKNTPRLIHIAREQLEAAGLPYVIENIEAAPLVDMPMWELHVITLCGASFGLGTGEFDLARHRLFESNHRLDTLPCAHRVGQTIGVYGNGTNSWHREKFGRCIKEREKQQAMGIDWMSRKELTQAIPPAYTEFIGKQLMAALAKAVQYEDQLPETMTDAEYDAWYAQSWIEDGVRVGRMINRLEAA